MIHSFVLAVFLCTAVLAGYGVRVARRGKPSLPRLGASPGSVLLPGWIVEAFYWSFHAPARLFVRTRISPDALTYLSLVLALGSLPLLATGRFGVGAAVLVLAGVLDAMDGMVARAQNLACPAGAVLDSCVDRVSDSAPLIGLAVFYRHDPLAMLVPLAALVGSSLVSYARAKAEIYGLALPNGLMRRHERIAYLVAALVLGPVAPTLRGIESLPNPLTLAGVLIIAVLANAAGVVLVARTRAALTAKARPPERPARAPAVPAPASRGATPLSP